MKKTLLTLILALTTTTAMAAMDHSTMDHAAMDHAAMDHSGMDHSQMDTTKMDHQMMNMKNMSDVGMPAMGSKPDKVVYVILSDDMKITFKKPVDIKPNDVVQFVVMNTGKMDHNFTIGSAKEQVKHRKMMVEMDHRNHEHNHDNGSSITVAPGKAKHILWHFHGDKNVELSCNMPGHAEAGMTKAITL